MEPEERALKETARVYLIRLPKAGLEPARDFSPGILRRVSNLIYNTNQWVTEALREWEYCGKKKAFPVT
jgi:hypothetical protein